MGNFGQLSGGTSVRSIDPALIRVVSTTFATHVRHGSYNGGAGLDVAGKWLGHKDPRSTQRYAHVNDNYLQDVMGGHKRR